MMNFWIASGLLLLAAIALAVAPLVVRQRKIQRTSKQETNIAQYHEQISELEKQHKQGIVSDEEFQVLKTELEKKLLADIAPEHSFASGYDVRQNLSVAVAVAIVIPALAIPVYWSVGAHTELTVTEVMHSPDLSPEEMLATLESWRKKRPDNPQALYLLGGQYLGAGRLDEAVAVYRDFYRVSDASQPSALLAQALYLQAGNRFNEEVIQLVNEALLKDEFNTTALGMQGIAAFETRDYTAAIAAWEKALSVETDTAARQSLVAGISHARSMPGIPVQGIRVQVQLSPEVSLPGNTRVMVYARTSGGSRMPLAIKPVLVSELPREVLLDDSSAMMSGSGSLMDAKALDVIAQVSLSGDVSKADYKAEVKSVNPGSREVVRLLITPAG